MKLSLRQTIIASVAALPLLGMLSYAEAQRQQEEQQQQQQQQEQQREAQFRPGQQAQECPVTDEILAHWMSIDNQAEVALAEFAQEQSRNRQVQQFAKNMVQGHRQLLSQVQQHAQQRPRTARQPQQPQQPQQQQQEQERQQQQQQEQERGAQFRPGQQQPGQQQAQKKGDVTDLITQVGQQRLNSTRQYLQEKQGEEFDKAFIGQQIIGHMDTLATLKTFEQYAQSPELKQTIQQAQQHVQQHFQQAQQIHQQLEGERPRAAQQQERQQQQQQ